MLEIAFRPDRRRAEPVYRQLAETLRGLIEAGRLPPGRKLPATRELAASLGLSRTTANLAYEWLGEAGYVRAHVGQGTFVAEQPPRRRETGDARDEGEREARAGLAWEGLFALGAEDARAPEALRAPRHPEAAAFDLRPGQVDPALLPRGELRRAFGRGLDATLARYANRLDPLGHEPLRVEIARSLVARGIACEPHEVLVVNGSQQALDLVARVLLDPDDAVAIEQPGYFGASLAFGARGAHRIALPVDEQGLRTDALARILRGRRVKLVYTTPAVQAPTGVVLSEARREALLELSERHQVPVLEDDYDAELRISGSAVPALQQADRAGRVIYLGTFSKALFPTLRLGYVVAPRPLRLRLAELHVATGFGSSVPLQAALAELLATGVLERHVRRVRRAHAERLEALLAAFDAHFPAGAERLRPAGGNAVWATLPPEVDAEAVRVRAAAEGVVYGRGDAWFLDGRGAEHLHLGFARLAPDAIAEGIARLGEVVRRCAPARPAPRRPAAPTRARSRRGRAGRKQEAP